MSIEETSGDVYRINLMDASGTPVDDAQQDVQRVAGMTMDRLLRNYAAILNARAIFYPVAYTLTRRLGRGRQGEVFLGLRQGARGCVTEHAIKVYDPGIYGSPEEYWTDMGRIASQISRLQRIHSPHVVSRHSYEETHGIGYVQMDAVDGMDLRRFLAWDHLKVAVRRCSAGEWSRFTQTIFRIEEGRVSLQPGVAVYILRGLLRGLERLHELNFLHSDVKPGNVMIDRLGNVKLIDFGRAVTVGEELSFLLGSPLYMAPEQHRRQIGDVRSDLYGVGLVALEMLEGRQLASEEVSEQDLLAIKLDLPDRMFERLPDHVLDNEALVSILRRLTAPDPDDRFVSAKEAEVGDEGLSLIDKQLVQAGLDSEYARDLSEYLEKLVNNLTQRIESEPAEDALS